MTITEVESSVKLHVPQMVCDNELGEHIPEPFPRKSFFMGIFGAPGSGKSSLMVSMLAQKNPKIFRGVFNTIYIICPSHSLASLKTNVFKEHPADQIFHELNVETLSHIKKRIEVDSEQGFTSLIVIDDQTVHLKDKGTERALREIIFNRRHFRTSIMILAQGYTQMPLAIRKCLSHFALYKSPNKKEVQAVLSELVFYPPNMIDEIANYTFTKKHDFLYGISDAGELYKNLNRLIIEE